MVKPRDAINTIKFIDTYCKLYQNLFVEVRSYEYFKYLHVGLLNPSVNPIQEKCKEHDWWNKGENWKSLINNMRLILQAFVDFNQLKKWSKVFAIPELITGFSKLMAYMNEFDCLRYLVYSWDVFCPDPP